MHPSFSIIFFTTASGAGFALFFLLGLGAPLGLLPESGGFAFTGLAIAVALSAGGLLTSTFHLGRPERAWRAVSQWRSSWLSREGVFATATFPMAAVFGIGWAVFGVTRGLVGFCGILSAVSAVATIVATGMIYAALKPVPQWHNPWVVPGYLVLALSSGTLILDFLLRLWVGRATGIALLALFFVLSGWGIKEGYWRSIDGSKGPSTLASATGLGSRGTVRLLDRPHTEENYLLQEMGFKVARKHVRRLRAIARVAGFLVPALLTLLALSPAGLSGVVAAGLAIASAALGLLAERWLFFAEAKHTVMLYYGAQAV
jgi:DMSO reductase anchor subunit